MPFSLSGGGTGNVTGKISLSSFKLQASRPPLQVDSELTELLNFPNPCKAYVFNEGPDLVEIRFASEDQADSAILIRPGMSWIETFSSVHLFAKSEGQARVRTTLLFNEDSDSDSTGSFDVTPLEVIAGEGVTGFEVVSPVTFNLGIRRENLGIDIQNATTIVDIYVWKMYESIILPTTTEALWDTGDKYVYRHYFNDSLIWDTTVIIDEPGRYFIGSDFNWAGVGHIARLGIDLSTSQVDVLSEIAF